MNPFIPLLEVEHLRVKKNLITIAAVAVTILSADANSGEVVKSASATKEELAKYWSQHDSHGLRAVTTTATRLHTLGGQPYAVFTVDATDKTTGRFGSAGHDLRRKCQGRLRFLAREADEFLHNGDRSLLKTALGREAVDLS